MPPGPKISPAVVTVAPLARSLLSRRLLIEPRGSGASMELAQDVVERHVARGQSDQRVEQHIGRFINDARALGLRVLELDRQLARLFANFFCDLFRALVEERSHVGACPRS